MYQAENTTILNCLMGRLNMLHFSLWGCIDRIPDNEELFEDLDFALDGTMLNHD